MTTMTSRAVDPSINDHLTRVQLRLMKEKLAQDQDASRSSTPQHLGGTTMDPSTVKLHRAMLQRQELLDKIKREQQLSDELRRPRSYQDHHQHYTHRTPTPAHRGASRQSLPDLRHSRDGSRAANNRQVVEHQFRPMKLDPLENPPQPPGSQVIQTTVPQPYILNTAPQPQAGDSRVNTKAELMELMMMQNAQMHQMMMQQLMMSAIPKPSTSSQDSSTASKVSLNLDDLINLKSERKRPPSVHHHHYDRANANPSLLGQQQQQQQPPPYLLPPVNVYQPQMHPYQSPRLYPMEVEPLKLPRARPKGRLRTPVFRTTRTTGRHPFPGPWPLRRFRQAAYAVWFAQILKKIRKGRRSKAKSLDEDFMFGIRLKEAVAAMHKIYLNPEGKMYGILLQIISETARDLSLAMADSSKKENKEAVDELIYIVENILYQLTEIMPTTGVLGTHRKSVVYEMIRNDKYYPRGYLWQIDRDKMHFDHAGRTHNVDDTAAFILLIGIFLNRGLVSTLMMKAVEYGLVNRPLTYRAERNVKVVASIFIYVARKVFSAPKTPPVQLPTELAQKLFTDDEMKIVFKKLKTSIDYAEDLLRQWGTEYVKRLRSAR